MKWKTFESRLLGKKVTFEFPVDIPGTSEFEFNPGMPPPMFQGDPRDNLRIIFSQSGLNIGLVNVKTKLNLSLSAQRNSSDPSGLTGVPVQLGRHIWYRHSIQGLTGNRFDERYHTDLTREYSLFFSIRSSDTRGDEQTVAELKRIAQHILESIKIE